MPSLPLLARVVATRTGRGGVVGRSRTTFPRRFAVDFSGGQLGALEPRADVEAVITASAALSESYLRGLRRRFKVIALCSTFKRSVIGLSLSTCECIFLSTASRLQRLGYTSGCRRLRASVGDDCPALRAVPC